MPLVWARVGDWDSILDLEELPEKARGLCFAVGAHEYATVVWHYVRTLAYAGQADASRARGTPGEAVLWDSLADKEASLLEVRSELVGQSSDVFPSLCYDPLFSSCSTGGV